MEAADGAIAAAREATDKLVTAMANARAGRTNGAQAPTPLQPAEPENTNWNRLSGIWGELKDRIDLLITEIPQKRVRAKYSRMHRRTYKHIIETLQKDGFLRGVLVDDLINLDRKYSALRFKPKEVTKADVELFEEVLRKANGTGALPPSSDEPESSDERPDPAIAVDYREAALNGKEPAAAARVAS
jgi:hypothetical protein